MTPPDELNKQGKDRGEGPRVTVAADAIATADVEHNRIQLNMRDVRTSERDKEGKVVTTSAPEQVQVLEAQKRGDVQVNHAVTEMDTGPLYKRVYKIKSTTPQERKEAAIEFHQRLRAAVCLHAAGAVGHPPRSLVCERGASPLRLF